MTAGVDLDPLAEVVFTRFLFCKDTSPLNPTQKVLLEGVYYVQFTF